jgi:hypothetical protein
MAEPRRATAGRAARASSRLSATAAFELLVEWIARARLGDEKGRAFKLPSMLSFPAPETILFFIAYVAPRVCVCACASCRSVSG